MTSDFTLRPITGTDADMISRLLIENWGSTTIVSRGNQIDAAKLPGFVAEDAERNVFGFITLRVDWKGCEVVTLDSFEPGRGIGTELLGAAAEYARSHGCKRLWLVTSNDNINALGFYQRFNMRMTAIYPDAITEARKIKPTIPPIAPNGIPIRDEIELELWL
ncbi:MAG: GNAT family N-acetyltransferase [Blastocatellia bacterium]|nr:GNAT family N-acetyltransferase [Blastocatellia bacterium]